MTLPPIKADTGFTTANANGYVKTDILQKLNGDSWLSGYATTAAVAAGYQPLDSDLTAIAALTTTAFGRSLLEVANAAAATTLISALPLSGGTLTGTLTLHSTGIVAGAATVSATEVSYLDGVTSAIQTQIDAKLATATAASTYLPLAGGIMTGPITGTSNIIEQRNASNAQTLRVYGTYTDSVNYVRAAISSSTTAITLAAETAGTGADNLNLILTPAGTGGVAIGLSAAVGKLHIGLPGTTTTSTLINLAPGSIILDNSNGGTTGSTVGVFGCQNATPAIGAGIGFTRTSSADWGTHVTFYTHPSNVSGIQDLFERMRITSAGDVGINEPLPDYKLDVNGTFGFSPGASVTPVDNGDVVFQLTSNTSFTIKAKGSDGTIRTVALTLA